MKLYDFNLPNSWQTWKKYFTEYDEKLNGVTAWIELHNPNYLILNYEYVTKNIEDSTVPFYKLDELKELGIIKEDNSIQVHVYNLKGHQGIINNYGANTEIYYDSEGTIKSSFRQGFVIISNALTEEEKHDPANYLYHAMGASGTYYVPSGWSPTVTWTYTPNATDKYGVTSLLTVAQNGTRWFHNQGETNKYYLKSVENTSSSIVALNSVSEKQIVSTAESRWTIQYRLEHDLLLEIDETNRVFEEIIGQELESQFVLVNEQGEGTYYSIINTDIDSTYKLPLYINYY